MYPIFAVYAPKSYHCSGDSRESLNATAKNAPLIFDGRTDVCQTGSLLCDAPNQTVALAGERIELCEIWKIEEKFEAELQLGSNECQFCTAVESFMIDQSQNGTSTYCEKHIFSQGFETCKNFQTSELTSQ